MDAVRIADSSRGVDNPAATRGKMYIHLFAFRKDHLCHVIRQYVRLE